MRCWGCKEIKPVHPKGNQSWIFIGRTDAEAETPVFWLSDEKNWLIWKDPDAGKDWRQEEKGTTEDEMAGLHYQLNGHEFEQAPEDGDGQGSMACCSPWDCKELDTAEWLNWTELKNVNFHLYYYLQSFILNMKCIRFILSNEKYWKVQEINEPVIFLPLPECSC